MVHRIYVEKKPEYAEQATILLHEIQSLLCIESVKSLRILNRYDVEGIDEDLFSQCIDTVFSEPQLDNTYPTLDTAKKAPNGEYIVFATEYLPGQFDQRADSAAECIQLISCSERPTVSTARIFLLQGDISDVQLGEIKKYVINPVEARLAELSRKDTLLSVYEKPEMVKTLHGFISLNDSELYDFREEYSLAMDDADLVFCRDYFKREGKDPTITEIRMIDTYWSDHCRHTTFGTVLQNITTDDENIKNSLNRYFALREEVYGEKASQKPQCLMDMAVIGAKALKKRGVLQNLDESDEINACSVKMNVDNNGKNENWLLLFKNETHNHPTEIEPFGGAATCIGGAIRDPLANRGYVYQAMRITGAGDPLVAVKDTLPGKLPQRKLVQTAAAGYSSYGNQIGLATGIVDEIYHPGYIAKRMEIGAVVGAVPENAVRREEPCAGDVVILLGGDTGRDGCGGATGSSKAHKQDSLSTCGAEVQKGNAPQERKLQRLFRKKEATLLIKRCNDFGAGGVSVAIGELADGLVINLDKVPKKYDGLDGTELAISESQERMAVVVDKKDVDKLISLANSENIKATAVATITQEKRLVMHWQDHVICDIDREFLNTNGAPKYISAHINTPDEKPLNRCYDGKVIASDNENLQDTLSRILGDLNNCSKKGLAERFDATIGAGSVLMPFGGKNQLSPAQAMVAKIPVLCGDTKTCSAMSWGFDPFLSQKSPYDGAYLAVVDSLAKLVATGFDLENTYLSFQEYFERLGTDKTRWGKPVAALLGALDAQIDFGVAAIGGKDSMSGSFEDIDVPPTLVSFAVTYGNTDDVISTELKCTDNVLVWLCPTRKENSLLPCAESQSRVFRTLTKATKEQLISSAWAVGMGSVIEGIVKMSLGNGIGFSAEGNISKEELLASSPGSFILELCEENIAKLKLIFENETSNNALQEIPTLTVLGKTTKEYNFTLGDETVPLCEVQDVFEEKLAPVFPYYSLEGDTSPDNCTAKTSLQSLQTLSLKTTSPRKVYTGAPIVANGDTFAKPRVLIPVFPGTNCEYDSAKAINHAGGLADIFVINNLTPQNVLNSVDTMRKKITESQIVFLPGGFSGGDEPEGSAKFIAAFFRNPEITEAVHQLLNNKDGLMLGICNGFQALIKLGLVPFGKIIKTDSNCPTLTFNTIARHQSMLVRTRISSNNSPWLMDTQVGDVHTVAISHGEGRFVAPEDVIRSLCDGGQIATQYVDFNDNATMDLRFNPNGSTLAIEGITSKDGRVFGKMGHSERSGDNLYKNVPGNKIQPIFKSGIQYFK